MVAQEIMNQLKVLGRIEMMSWGAHAFKALGPDQLKSDFEGHLGALIFAVQGRLFKGHVSIVLMPNDTYTIHFGSLRKGRFNSKQKFSDVYVDNLIEVIDAKVETV